MVDTPKARTVVPEADVSPAITEGATVLFPSDSLKFVLVLDSADDSHEGRDWLDGVVDQVVQFFSKYELVVLGAELSLLVVVKKEKSLASAGEGGQVSRCSSHGMGGVSVSARHRRAESQRMWASRSGSRLREIEPESEEAQLEVSGSISIGSWMVVMRFVIMGAVGGGSGGGRPRSKRFSGGVATVGENPGRSTLGSRSGGVGDSITSGKVFGATGAARWWATAVKGGTDSSGPHRSHSDVCPS